MVLEKIALRNIALVIIVLTYIAFYFLGDETSLCTTYIYIKMLGKCEIGVYNRWMSQAEDLAFKFKSTALSAVATTFTGSKKFYVCNGNK